MTTREESQTPPVQHEDGIYFNLPMEAYRADPALGSGSINALNVSPLTYWRSSPMNPQREPEDRTDATGLGDAFHCRLLEGPEVFRQRFAEELDPADFPGVPKSAKELEARCIEMGIPKSGTKEEKEARILAKDPSAVLWSDIEFRHMKANMGKAMLSRETIAKIEATALQVADHPDANKALSGGAAEVSIFWTDPETEVRCKARLDRLKTRSAIDLKTFSNKNREPIDRAISKAMTSRGYGVQAVHYSQGLEMAKQPIRTGTEAIRVPGGTEAECIGASNFIDECALTPEHRFIFVFIESCAFPAIRVREYARVLPGTSEESEYWKSSRARIRAALQTYAACIKAFGPDKPWVDVAPVSAFTDEEMFYAL